MPHSVHDTDYETVRNQEVEKTLPKLCFLIELRLRMSKMF